MKRNLTDAITVITVFATLGGAVRLAAQEQEAIHPGKGEHRHYKLFDLGTLGGPASYFSASGIGAQILNNGARSRGTATRPLLIPTVRTTVST
jgi:hypothetical protein